MTSTKIAYLIAAIVPFGFVIIGAVALAHAIFQRRKAKAAAALAVAT